MDQTSRVEELVSQWKQLLNDGQYVPAEELCSECPDLLGDVQARIKSLEPKVSEETAQSNEEEFPTATANFNLEEEEFAESATIIEKESDSEVGSLVMNHSYRKLRFHARGGLGEIYVADDAQLKRDVVLKFIKGKHRKRRDCNEQFRLEAEVTARLDHPGVVPVYGFGRTPDGRLCYAMRFIQGETLEARITDAHSAKKTKTGTELESLFHRDRIIELRTMLGQIISVCQTIAYANNRGILHRDIKPDNIMLGKYGDTLVVDWGLAMPINRDDSAKASGEATLMPSSGNDSSGGTGGPVGTPGFMSPEQATGAERLTAATDIFSLGAMLYKILTGRSPYRGDSARETVAKA
jgi:serine/threonine protein kinase